MGTPLRVLVVEDSEEDALLLARRLRQAEYDPSLRRVDTPEEMSASLAEETWDVIIADYTLPGFGGIEALNLYRKSGLDVPFIIVSGTIGEETAVAAMKGGAHDYVRKENTARLIPAIERELREAAERRARRRAEQALKEAEAEKRRFYQEVVLAVTGGRLILEERGEIDYPCEDPERVCVKTARDIREARRKVRARALVFGLPPQRVDDLELAFGEAAANAWKHAGGGSICICEANGALRVTVADRGHGIDPGQLARAAFEKGYSTAQTLGMGYTLMLSLSDRVRLVTDGSGTIVALEMERRASPRPAPWESWRLGAASEAP
ncbi:MAG: ATP-binding protein [Armatimonadetes bacterium]|nr:ATP-binding protein [Armatimonadota bacterium]